MSEALGHHHDTYTFDLMKTIAGGSPQQTLTFKNIFADGVKLPHSKPASEFVELGDECQIIFLDQNNLKLLFKSKNTGQTAVIAFEYIHGFDIFIGKRQLVDAEYQLVLTTVMPKKERIIEISYHSLKGGEDIKQHNGEIHPYP